MGFQINIFTISPEFFILFSSSKNELSLFLRTFSTSFSRTSLIFLVRENLSNEFPISSVFKFVSIFSTMS